MEEATEPAPLADPPGRYSPLVTPQDVPAPSPASISEEPDIADLQAGLDDLNAVRAQLGSHDIHTSSAMMLRVR